MHRGTCRCTRQDELCGSTISSYVNPCDRCDRLHLAYPTVVPGYRSVDKHFSNRYVYSNYLSKIIVRVSMYLRVLKILIADLAKTREHHFVPRTIS